MLFPSIPDTADMAWFLANREAMFPVCAHSTFLAHSATAPLPWVAGQTLEEYGRRHSAHWQNEFDWNAEAMREELKDEDLDPSAAMDPHFHVRFQLARFLGAHPDEVALVPNTVLGLGFLAESIPWQNGDRVLLTQYEFPANVHPWRNAERLGLTVDTVPMPADFRITWETLEPHLTPRTRLVTLSAVHYLTGFRADISRIGRELRERDIRFCVDGIQAIGAMPVRADDADYITAGGQKWMMCPKGSGLLYIRRELIDELRPHPLGWLSALDKADYVNLNDELDPTARRFEGGTAVVPSLVGMKAVFRDVFNRLGIEAISARIRMLNDCIVETGERFGWKPLFRAADDSEKSGIVSFPVANADADTLMSKLTAEKQLYLTVRPDFQGRPCVRFAPQFYNTPEEIERAFELLTPVFDPVA